MRHAKRIAAAAAIGAFVGLSWLETRRPLRRRIEPKPVRVTRNAAVAATSALTIRMLERPLIDPLARAVGRRRLGLVPRLGLPPAVETALSVALLDYTLWVWHVLLHRVPLLWRFHRVHHADLELDASTALRFHFGEMALSVPWRAAQVVAIGVTPAALQIWRNATLASVVFHHSDIRLPPDAERVLGWFVMTPQLHGIHHSERPEEMNTNWSSGLILWDRLHRTLLRGIPQEAIAIGVPGLRDPSDVALGRLLVMPFVPDRRSAPRPARGESQAADAAPATEERSSGERRPTPSGTRPTPHRARMRPDGSSGRP